MSFFTAELIGKQAYLTTDESDDEVVVEKVGRIHFFVFAKNRCIGILVKRPDAALMFRRKDLFAPISSCAFQEKAVIIDKDYKEAGEKFLKENNLSLAKTFVWDAMDVFTQSGTKLGSVDTIECKDNGEVIHMKVTNGGAADALLGRRDIPANLILGMKQGSGGARLMSTDKDRTDEGMGALLVSDEAGKLSMDGGAAEKAALGTVAAKEKATQAADFVKENAGPAAEKAKEVATKAASDGTKFVGKKYEETKSGILGFKDEFLKSLNGEE